MVNLAIIVQAVVIIFLLVFIAWLFREWESERSMLLNRIQAPELAPRASLGTQRPSEPTPAEEDFPDLSLVGTIVHGDDNEKAKAQ